jgi:hypothetical protein
MIEWVAELKPVILIFLPRAVQLGDAGCEDDEIVFFHRRGEHEIMA